MDRAAGEAHEAALRVTLDPRLKLEFHGSRVTSDAGLLPFRDLDDALGLTDLAGEVLVDTRTGQNSRHTLMAQLRQSVFGRLAGYADVNDADRLAHDPALRWIVGGRAVTQGAASTSQMGRFETEVLTQEANLFALANLSGCWIDRVHAHRPVRGIVLDVAPASAQPLASKKGPLPTATLAVPATILSSCSTSSATWSGVPCSPATSTPPRVGVRCWSRWSPATGPR